MREAEHVVIVIGTPIDEHLNPDLNAVQRDRGDRENLVDGQLLVLRSTVYPGVTAMVEKLVERLGLDVDVSFCPERIAEGKAMVELFELPQIVAARTQTRRERERCSATSRTRSCTSSPRRPSWRSSFTNTWRYIKFATRTSSS